MQPELTQLTREKLAAASDPVQYARSQAPDIEDIHLSRDAVETISKFADVLEYPDEGWHGRLARLCREMSPESATAKSLSGFYGKMQKMPLIPVQELYAQSFDLNPNCALEIGYHLFGEDYKRGAFLANLREAEEPFDIGQEQQLPDYLPVLLRLLTKLDDDALRGSLTGHCLVPGVDKIISAFKDENPFAELMKAILAGLKEALENAHQPVVVFD
ncbi:MAG: Nitrate reductase delta subunit [Acidobacteria bacterium OLB17]|nr:MAG: Nitrate reductase delta subunit [Acidobacteria bacterium OLB17]MCZ2392181.1 hypothetical protein [Acidobacteriota bacterium]